MSKKLIGNRAHWALKEALRRYTRFHRGEDLLTAWTGLGTKTTYKEALEKGFMAWVHGEPYPRTANWLRLTSKGARIVQRWLDQGYTHSNIESGHKPDNPPVTVQGEPPMPYDEAFLTEQEKADLGLINDGANG